MSDEPIYLDFNATTPVAPSVREAMEPYFSEHFGNPSSAHAYGERANRAVESAREQVAGAIGASAESIYFTGSGTEANNLALRGAAETKEGSVRIASSAIEHPSVSETCRALEERGAKVVRIGVDREGRIRLAELEEALREGLDLVTVMHANNEVGTVQPIAEVSELAEEYGALVHTDAAQTIGKIDVSVEELGVDLLTIAGHKMYAPKGVGALYVREGVEIEPVLFGASQEGGLRPSTENVPYLVALGRASDRAAAGLGERRREMAALRDRLWEALKGARPTVRRHGSTEETLPNTLNVRFDGVSGAEVLECTDAIAASTGSACHEGGELQPSEVLTAMGIEPSEATGAIRLSVGESTTTDEVDRAAVALIEAYRSLAVDNAIS